MDIPDEVQQLVDELGETVVASLLNDARSRAIAQEIQDRGFNLALAVEASISITPKDPSEETDGAPQKWSDEDRAFLRTFRIKLD